MVVNNENVSSILDSGVTVAQQMMSVLDDGEDRLIENPMRKRKDRGCDHDDDGAEEIIQADPKKVHCDDETSSLAVGNGGSVDATFASLIGAPPVPIPVTHINNIDEGTSAAWEENLHHIQQSKPSKEDKNGMTAYSCCAATSEITAIAWYLRILKIRRLQNLSRQCVLNIKDLFKGNNVPSLKIASSC